MPSIGRVTIGSTTNQKIVRIRQQTQTSLSTPNYGPALSLSLDDLNDVVVVDPLQGYTLVYNASTNRFEVSEPEVLNITGGTF